MTGLFMRFALFLSLTFLLAGCGAMVGVPEARLWVGIVAAVIVVVVVVLVALKVRR
jgi:hypothetical protein